MQNELLYLPNIKLLLLEKFGNYFKTNINGEFKTIKNLESLGLPFPIITKNNIDKLNSFKQTPEFRELSNPLPIASTLEYYLRNAEIEFTLSKRADGLNQYLGLTYGKPATIEIITNFSENNSEINRTVIACQFYIIKDASLDISFVKPFKETSPTSESSPTPSEASD